MSSGRVLVIDGDEWTSQLLVRGLREKGYTVDVCSEAMPGFRKACETIPDCIVLAPELPDIDGAWVARRVRTEPGAISKVPILFVGELTEPTVRTQTLNVGADVFLARPISNDEVIAQVGALIAMTNRLVSSKRQESSTDESGASSSAGTSAIRGDLSAFPLASMLMMFEMERRSGQIEITSQSGKRATITMNGGLFASTEISGQQRPALDTLREVLSWRSGRFSFATKESGNLPAARASIGALVLEAMRLEDEEKEQAQEIDAGELIEDELPMPEEFPLPTKVTPAKPEPAKVEVPRVAGAPRPRTGSIR